jgi:hypothetical protein
MSYIASFALDTFVLNLWYFYRNKLSQLIMCIISQGMNWLYTSVKYLRIIQILYHILVSMIIV